MLGAAFAGVVRVGAGNALRDVAVGPADPVEPDDVALGGVDVAAGLDDPLAGAGFVDAGARDVGEVPVVDTADELETRARVLADGVPVRIGSGADSDGVCPAVPAAVARGSGAPVAGFPELRPDPVADDFPAAGPDAPEGGVPGAPVDVAAAAAVEPAAAEVPVKDAGVVSAAVDEELGAADELGVASTPVSAAEVVPAAVFTAPAGSVGALPAAAILLTKNHTIPTTRSTAAAITSTRRIQYTLGSRGPTGCITNPTVTSQVRSTVAQRRDMPGAHEMGQQVGTPAG